MAVQVPSSVPISPPAPSPAVEAPRLVTGEQLAQLGDIGRTELVKGVIIHMSPTGYLHGRIEGNLGAILRAFVSQHKLGEVLVGEVGIYTARGPDTVRGADVAYISNERLARVQSSSYLDVAPELVVEVLSPDDRWGDLVDKLSEYFAVGVQVVWVADPKTQSVYVYHSLNKVQHFSVEDALPGGDVLPDLSVPVADLFARQSAG
jgi:Uma2 family endonuclease